MAAYGSSQYGSHARVVVSADVVAPPGPGTNLSGTSVRSRTASGTLSSTRLLSGTSTRARTGSATAQLVANTVTWNIELSQSGFRARDAHATITVEVAVVPPPASAAETFIKKVQAVYPTPTLDQYGRPS